MVNIKEFQENINIKTSKLVLLSIVTGGIYPILWLFKNYRYFDEVTEVKTANSDYIIWLAVCTGLVHVSYIGVLFSLASGILYLVWAYRAKSALENYAAKCRVDLKMNGIYVFLFNIFYINYCINKLPELEKKYKNLNQSTTTENKHSKTQEENIEKESSKEVKPEIEKQDSNVLKVSEEVPEVEIKNSKEINLDSHAVEIEM